MRNYGLTQRAGGPNLAGGNVQRSARLPIALDTHQRNSLPPLPSGSIASSPSFKRRGFLQALIDVAALGAFGLVIGSAAVAAGLLVYAAYLRFVPQFI